jgi:hypothetical protein
MANSTNIIDTAGVAANKLSKFLEGAVSMNKSTFRDEALRLAVELIKYGDYIKTTLLFDASSAVPRQARTHTVDPKMLEGASEEEKAAIERTPPAQ